MPELRKVHPLLRDLGLTGGAQVAGLVASVVVTSLFGRLMGATALAEYLLLRRIAIWMQTGVQVGMGVALPRYVAHSAAGPKGSAEAYFVAAALCLAALVGSATLILNLASRPVAVWFFGGTGKGFLILPLTILLAGFVTHVAIYGYYRGCLRMDRANAMQCWNMALVPLAVVVALFRFGSVPLIVIAMGVAIICSSAVFAVPILRRVPGKPDLARIRELLRYGVARVPGDFGAAALFALGPIVASHFMPLNQVTYLLLGTSLLMAVSVTVAPVGLVLLSKASMMIAQNRIAEVRQPLEHLLAAVLEMSVFGCLQLVAFADVVMRLWVGRGFAERVTVIQILCLAIPAYLLYAVLRSFIDAASVKAYNARNIIIALACFLVLTGTGIGLAPRRWLLEAIAGALLAALAVLALLTSETVCSLYGLRMHWSRCLPSIAWSAGLFGAAVLARHCAGLLDNPAGQIAVETAAAGLFGAMLVKSRTPWLMYFREMVLPKRELVYSAPSC